MDGVKAAERGRAIQRSSLLTALTSSALSGAVELASHVTGMRSAGVHLLDDRWQHRVAAKNAPLTSMPIEQAPCLQVVEADTAMHSADATQDGRFSSAALTGPVPMRAFASTPVRDQAGLAVGTVCAFDASPARVDARGLAALDGVAALVSELFSLHRANDQLAHRASHDALTGLPNRALLSDHLLREMSRRHRRSGEPVVAVLDLDGFKPINDRYGHAAGDTVLVEVATRLKQAMRTSDMVARLAGDEFVIVAGELPADTSAVDFAAVLEDRIRSCLAAPVMLGERAVSVRASVGVVCAEAGELSYEVLGRADAAMFTDKRGAR